jgi:hypothetical protein
MSVPPSDFDAYWRAFVRAHENPLRRRTQLVATTAGISVLALGVFARRLSLLILAPVVGLVPPVLLEKALGEPPYLPPAALYRLLASIKMWGMTLAGTFEEELVRAALENAQAPEDTTGQEPHPPTNMVTDHTLH